ncbi:single-stranded DNA-binding protein [Clostridium pasteurianum]|uniref:Single-stranded DNA-binding protein n=1 Tax=Clostridium pasteurianum BC1 TaxID=86416 RepID=R4KEJ9_CLOPA|nr:single-stranded DNA-binding protein [Clostridium pasteurianum]AGK98025.1 single stranded DNA-binding protein [Clostridium pasteurianum BC1]
MNKIQLVGHLVKDPDLKFIQGSGTPVVKFTLVINRPRFDKNKPQEADFFNCTMFGKRAETIANYVFKGHLFGLSGRVQINKYAAQDGTNRWSTDVMVEDFDLLQPKGVDNNSKNQSSKVLEPVKNNDEYLKADITPIDDGDIPFKIAVSQAA